MPQSLRSPAVGIIVILVVAIWGTASSRGDDWPHWRGPARSGVVHEDSGFDRGAWPPGKPLWTDTLGLSGSGPIVADGRLYTLGWKDNREWVY
ncbi:MAG: hypothetical protein VX311_10325 [Planctomycetota bacterium]|nr:hypothetical protein [Planctomycetota bacterium]